MSADPAELTIHTDGAARGNPGPAAYAFTIVRPGGPTVERAGALGTATNNVAEYTALVKALEYLADQPAARLLIHSDSELMIKQLRGEYRVKNADLQDYFDRARTLLHRHAGAQFIHVRREKNKRTDQLCNDVLDGRPPGSSAPKSKAKKPAGLVSDSSVRDDAITCVAAALVAWGRGDRKPTAEQVWEQVWSVLSEGGVLKKVSK